MFAMSLSLSAHPSLPSLPPSIHCCHLRSSQDSDYNQPCLLLLVVRSSLSCQSNCPATPPLSSRSVKSPGLEYRSTHTHTHMLYGYTQGSITSHVMKRSKMVCQESGWSFEAKVNFHPAPLNVNADTQMLCSDSLLCSLSRLYYRLVSSSENKRLL